MGIFDKLTDRVSKDWHVIMSAKGTFGLASIFFIGLAGYVTWRGADAFYGERFETQKATIENQKSIIDQKQASIERLSSQPPPKIDASSTGSTTPAVNVISWYGIAVNEIGTSTKQSLAKVVEYISTVQSTKGILDKDNDLIENLDWSSSFVEWTFNQAGIRGPKNPDPVSWTNWGRQIDKPETGCVVILIIRRAKHVGFYVGVEKEKIRILGGNQLGANEDKVVSIKAYEKQYIVGYRMPPT
jgi:uncharacterized protein (TIGR02594 family)